MTSQTAELVTVQTPAGDVPGEIVARAPYCTAVRYAGSAQPVADWFCARTGVRRGESSVRIVMETQGAEQ
jgi:hypothetical protein